ncbi:MAG: hypothetical protein IPK82_25075 [Polyangiaceae bacterium]|nr:hypothetical protein [Polyangiaceae bacterium]
MASPKTVKKKTAPKATPAPESARFALFGPDGAAGGPKPPRPSGARRVKRPSQAIGAITAPPFQLTVLEKNGPRVLGGAGDSFAVAPPTLFAATLLSPPEKRYLHLVQKTTHSPIADELGLIVFLAVNDCDESTTLRFPSAGTYLRAMVKGSVHVLASDKILTREQIIAHVGGHEPGPTHSRPPYT